MTFNTCQLLNKFVTMISTIIGIIGIFNFQVAQAVDSSIPTLTPPFNLQVMENQPTPINIYTQMRKEALALYNETYRPLPLLHSWNQSTWWNYNQSTAGFSPAWQLDMLAQEGCHFLPSFNTPRPSYNDKPYNDYFQDPIEKAEVHNLPISFVGTQWERLLYDEARYFSLPAGQNPNVVALDGTIMQKVSPFGGIQAWYDAGYKWGSSPLMQQIITWYPNPPLVIFVSNNEAKRLEWTEAETSKRYVDTYGYGTSDEFKRQKFCEGWETRYKELIRGFREGLQNINWKNKSKFIAYQAISPGYIGRWSGWEKYSLYIQNQISPYPKYWEGGIAELYIWPDRRDNMLVGPLFQAMNIPFIVDEARKIKPTFLDSIVVWHGDTEAWAKYTDIGQSFTPSRYEGIVQFSMWVNTPRIVSAYDHWQLARSEYLQWYQPVIDSVDRVWKNDILKSFWRKSDLVVHPSRKHPYQHKFPPEYGNVDRMYLLSTNLDPAEPWTYSTEFAIMSIARVKGTNPNRQWLLYAYAPTGSKTAVQIAIPDFKTITVNVSLEGSFYLIDEATNNITPITNP